MTKEQECLVVNNLKLVRWFCHKFHIDYEEFNDVLYESLVKAALKYDTSLDIQFSSFAVTVMKNDYLKQCYRNNRFKPEGTISLDSIANPDADNKVPLVDILSGREQKIDAYTSEAILFAEWFNKQTPRNKKIMVLLGLGNSGTEIGKEIGISRQRISAIKLDLLNSYKSYRAIHS